MTTASGWAYYYRIRPTTDHMDTLRLYKDYKFYWDKHRIPGETKINEVLWEDTWWKANSPFRSQRRLPPISKKNHKTREKSSSPNREAPSSPDQDKSNDKQKTSTLPSITPSSIVSVSTNDAIEEKSEKTGIIVPSIEKTRDDGETSSSASSRSSSRSSTEAEITVS